MKKYIYKFAILLFFLNSCKPEHIKIKERLNGTWQLESFNFQSVQGTNNSSNTNKYSIEFKNNKMGVILTDSIKFDFTYDFGYEQFDSGFADCDIKVENNKKLPTNVFGRVQVYSYKFIDNNTIIFYAENEFNYITNQVMKNLQYTFVRI